jgi:hypothetical protein
MAMIEATDTTLGTLSKVIVSFYMSNVPDEVVKSQRAVMEKFAPADFAVEQTLTSESHAFAIDEFFRNTKYDLIVLMDIDCVPLNSWSMPTLAAHAARGELAGCVQRANHLDNQRHLYVGPFCMAVTRRLWEQLGRPSFQPTERGDVGEELTYRCEVLKYPIHMIWPSAVEEELWDLTNNQKFGLNTEYAGSFLHTFGIRDSANQRKFVKRCRDIIETDLDQPASRGQPEVSVGIRCQPAASTPSASREGSAYIDSDKYYWHRYIDKYEQAFMSLGEIGELLEFGVHEGGSIRWLAARFPHARIVGVDIIAPKPSWPRNERIEYIQADQGDRRAIATMLNKLDRRYDLIIEDGSHLPAHQASCLIEAFSFVRPRGLYILEDIHTSHPNHPDFKHYNSPETANCLHVLLAMQHLKDCSQLLKEDVLARLATPGFFSTEDLRDLFSQIGTIELYKRTSLPLRCWRCGSGAFDYQRLRCACGADLYSETDSMAFLLLRI